MSQYSYRIAARTEAAGKYDPSAPREGNEDSLVILPDVGNTDASLSTDTVIPLPEKGTLMVVADGMGGHNAGEVASQIAVETVKEMFSADKIADKQFDTPKSRAHYLEAVVVAADKNIRANANDNPERRGMGSTIVMVWIVGNELTVTWCGDSRAYLYRSGKGLKMLSEDHSMVQDLVRKKQISYEETFSHPQGNIITRCLGGGGKSNAEPESRQFILEDGDIIMLCSDGLSGVVFDYEKYRDNGEPYSIENLQDIISRQKESLKDTLSCLFDAARRCDWYDNVTAILFEIKTSGQTALPDANSTKDDSNLQQREEEKKKRKWVLPVLITIPLLIVFLGGIILSHNCSGKESSDTTNCDSIVDSSRISDTVPATEAAVSSDTTKNTASTFNNKTEKTGGASKPETKVEKTPDKDTTKTDQDTGLTLSQ